MADLGKGQKPLIMPHYPHMMAEDIEVWSKFLASGFGQIAEVWYDVHVGSGISIANDVDAMVKKVAAGVGKKRIDVVCRVGGGFWVVEVKPYATMLALGQAVSYRRLFIDEFRPVGAVWPVIVCDDYDRDLASEFDILGVAVIVND